jgi:hypothetical protein
VIQVQHLTAGTYPSVSGAERTVTIFVRPATWDGISLADSHLLTNLERTAIIYFTGALHLNHLHPTQCKVLHSTTVTQATASKRYQRHVFTLLYCNEVETRFTILQSILAKSFHRSSGRNRTLMKSND